MRIAEVDEDELNPAIIKFQIIVERHFLKRTLAELHKIDESKIDINLVTKLSSFKETLEEFFPAGNCWNIGIKFAENQKNIFMNEFLYGILQMETPDFND